MTTRRTNPIAAQIATEIDQAARRLAETNAAIAATPALDTADLWRLFQTDSAAAWTALANLSEQQLVVQATAMAAHILDTEDKLVSSAYILADWQAKIARRNLESAPALVPTDPTIPALGAILDAAVEAREAAARHYRHRAARRLDRVHENLLKGARMAWDTNGDLLVQSANNPGQVYRVGRVACTCPNGGARCWHVALRDLLITMSEDRAAAADILADAAAARDEEPQPPHPTIGVRIAQARAASSWWQQEAA